GRGVGEAAFLAECGAKLIITDLKTRGQLKSSLTKLQKYNPEEPLRGHGAGNIKFVLGEHRLEDFKSRDFILKAASVPLNSPYIAEARRNKIPVEMSASLFARLSDVPVIGVTGTRGKSTVAHLIFHILKTAGKRAVLGGNVLGVSNLPFLKKADELDFAVLELDSWQLQGFGESRISPHIAVFTTFYPDHLNYYGNKMKRYFDDKALIFSNQKKGDILVAGKQALPYIKRWGGRVKGKLVVPSILPREFSTQLLGAHNEYNVALAVAAARSLGVNDDMIKKAIRSFKGVPYRLELVRTVRGIKIYNDTTATTPEATIAALKALGHSMSKLGDKRIVLIMGGSDKGLDMSG
ncbi:MAG: UDP-N-acetylmuramoyl-L-alanine--D-glutamate ligase, partial [Patescibacteria group bacterium]